MPHDPPLLVLPRRRPLPPRVLLRQVHRPIRLCTLAPPVPRRIRRLARTTTHPMNPHDSWTCHCGAENAPRARTCADCGRERPPTPSRPAAPTICPLDHTRLHPNGSCPTGQGFPITQRTCPDACPSCRRPLRWDGDCDTCKPPDAKPGHAYTYEPYTPDVPTSGHWHISTRGPQPITGPTFEQRTSPHPALTRLHTRSIRRTTEPPVLA